MHRTTDTSFDLKRHLHHQVPQSASIVDPQLYFKCFKFNDMHAMPRAKKQAATKEDVTYVLEEIWGLTPEETPCEIFAREACWGIDEDFFLSKEERCDL